MLFRLALLALTIGGTAVAAATPKEVSDLVFQRRAHMEEFNAAMQTLGQQIMSGKPDRAVVLEQAKTIHELAVALPGWFPAGTDTDHSMDSQALPAVWQNPADFAAKADALVKASDDLATFAEAGDMKQLMSKAIAVDGACVACHKAYQKR